MVKSKPILNCKFTRLSTQALQQKLLHTSNFFNVVNKYISNWNPKIEEIWNIKLNEPHRTNRPRENNFIPAAMKSSLI
jgi:hypothetical protein